MFGSIVVGTDGSETATQAVRQATDLASAVGARIDLVSAYEPVPTQRLREEKREAPEDLQSGTRGQAGTGGRRRGVDQPRSVAVVEAGRA